MGSYCELDSKCMSCRHQHLYPNGEPCCSCYLGNHYVAFTTVPSSKETASSSTSPAHYSRFPIQPLDFIIANGLNFLVGNVIKYVCRYDAKNGVEDLEKAKTYLERLIKETKKDGRTCNG